MGDVDWLPDCHWGYVGAPPGGLPYDDTDPADDELAGTQPDVVLSLGFDPAKVDW